MAREHARILTRIWRGDEDWRALPWEGQHMYFLLLSQPTLTHAGTLPLTLTRWAGYTEGRAVDDVEKVVRLLEDRRFVVVDWDTEELLIRSFIRNDGVYRQPNVLKAAMRVAVEDVESQRLKVAIAEELLRVGLTQYASRLNPSANPSGNPSPNPPTGGGETPPETPSTATPNGKGSANPSGKGSKGVTGRYTRETRGRGEGGVVISSSVRTSVGGSAQQRGTRIPNGFAPTPDLLAWARDRTPHVDTDTETEKFVNYWRAKPGRAGVKLDWPATWRNWMLKAQQDAAHRPGAHLRAVPAPTTPNGQHQLTNDEVDEILGPEAPPNAPDDIARQGPDAMRTWWETAGPEWREDRRKRAHARLTARAAR